MKTLLRTVTAIALLAGAGWAGPASAQERGVLDSAGMFSDAAKTQANQRIAEIKQQFNKDLVIEATKAPARPANVNKDDKAAVDRFFSEWAHRRYAELGVRGVYVGITSNPNKIRVEAGKATEERGFFTDADERELIGMLQKHLTDKNPDAALQHATEFVQKRMREHNPAVQPTRQPAPPPGAAAAPRVPSSFGGLGTVGTVIVGLLLVWLLVAVIRGIFSAFAGGGGPGYGYGGGPGFGGGGGGFFTGLLGGMFGAAAGMWMYNNFFGGHHASTGYDPGAAGGPDKIADPNAGDATSTGQGGDYGNDGGGDWGDSGGDAGGDAGGGDWGGGGDFGGGGGDW